jgi:hypothetical protein
MAPHWPMPEVMAGSRMTAARVVRGAISYVTSIRCVVPEYKVNLDKLRPSLASL